jgi:Asp-tRNA(Asn)/Glu-tRNA(Gln) amidotransferase C subunit
MEDKSIFERMLKTAEESYGLEEAERLKTFIKRISDAVRKVQEFELEPGDEPASDPREDR